MFEVVIEYGDGQAEIGAFEDYEDAVEAAADACDEPGACPYVYEDGELV